MAFIRGFINYFVDSRAQIFSLLLEHIQLTAIAVGVAILIGVPLGILICYIRKASKPVLGVANVIQAVPSMALLGFAIPILGIGTVPAVVVVVLYSLLPIIKNTFAGIHGISPEMVEAARASACLGSRSCTRWQIPQALPVIMVGVRISAVTAVGLMTMARVHRPAAAWATWSSPASAPWTTIRSSRAPCPPACWPCWWTSSSA